MSTPFDVNPRFVQPLIPATALALLAIGFAPPVHADPLPPKDSASPNPTTHQFGFSDGTLLLYTGDSLFEVDRSDPDDPAFALVATGFEDVIPGSEFEGDFATAPGGNAAISFGFSTGGVILVDLDALGTGTVADASTPAPDFADANVFSLAGRSDGTFFAEAVASDFSTSTAISRIDPVTAGTTFVVDPAAGTGFASGGIAFDEDDGLIASAFDFTTFAFPDPRGTAAFFEIDADEITDFEAGGDTPAVASLGGGITNGNGEIVAALGLVFFNTTTGIGQFDPATGEVTNLVGDITDPDLFTFGDEQPFNGLAFDPATNELIFAAFDASSGGYFLDSIVVPEPGAAWLLVAGLGLAARRRKGGV